VTPHAVRKLKRINSQREEFSARAERFQADVPRVVEAIGNLFGGTPGERADARVELLEVTGRVDAAGDLMKSIAAGIRDVIANEGG
jgi:hypothetical protein